MDTYYTIETSNDDVHLTLQDQATTEPVSHSNKAEWGTEETKYMLQQYETYIKQVGPLKQFKNKKCMWTRIAEEINEIFCLNRTQIQVENRYKTVLKRKKEAIENNTTSGCSRMDVPFEEELTKISSLDDSIQPEILRSANNVRVGKLVSTTESSCSSNISTDTDDMQLKPKKRKLSLAEVIMETAKIKEENKERRHKEKMELLKQYLNKD